MGADEDRRWMRLALEEAARGVGRTSPNPCVGAVIVDQGRLVASGWHRRAGGAHAERNAISAARDRGEELAGTTLYVTLEPCSHTGRTPPCCDAIIEQGFTRVVVGMTDPNPLVNGSGTERLRAAGIEVETGVLEAECRQLNRPFIKYITTGMPWVMLKAGLSLDGRLNYRHGEAGAMTGSEARCRVHQLRNRVDAIMVGRCTVAIDNPSLTTRLHEGETRDALRVVVDSHLSLPVEATLFHLDSAAQTLVFCSGQALAERGFLYRKEGVELCAVDCGADGLDLHQVLKELGRRQICSLLVEGGGVLHGALLQGRFYDEAVLFYGPVFAGDGGQPLLAGLNCPGRSAAPQITPVACEPCGDGFVVRGLLEYPCPESSC